MDRKKHRLMLQITAIVLPLFLVLSAAAVWLLYRNTIDSYLTGQKTYIEDALNSDHPFISNNQDPEKAGQCAWLFSYWETHSEEMRNITPEELDDAFTVLFGENGEFVGEDSWSVSWYQRLTDQQMHYAAAQQYTLLDDHLNSFSEKSYYEKMFLLDTHDSYMGMVIAEYDSSGNDHKIGDRYDLDFSRHKALKKAIDSGKDEIVFEESGDFPAEGVYYIAYKPVILNSETRAVLGLAYNWKDFKDSIDKNYRKAIILIIAGIIVIMLILMLLLYHKAVRPVTAIQQGLLDYTGDKDTKQIVKKMYEVKEKNEIGYLADVISDLALEIDLYTKEAARIAAEKEHAEKELYEAEVKIMVSQIRPHFLYNALTSIAMMCELDPKRAKEATITFAKYLRVNMDSLRQTKPVPFSQELSHLKNYLYIEKLRFDDLLNVEYDIQTTDFEVPQLSIQPIVENAVKHGVGMAEDGGTVTISTKETDDAYEVIISDDGVGFDTNAPKPDDGRTHIGMENTKKRLKDLCGAEVIITSEIGTGTTARVIIPKKKEEQNEDTVSG